MAIRITDFEWDQKEQSIFLKIGIKNSASKNVRVVCTSSYIKVNFNSYLFEAFLRHDIIPERSSSIIKEGNLGLHLTKASKQIWDSLTINPNKKEAQNLRFKALKEFENIEEKKHLRAIEAKRKLQQRAITQQINLNEEKHQQKQKIIKEEKSKFFNTSNTKAEADRGRLSSTCSEGSGIASEGDYDGDEESFHYSSCENISEKAKSYQKGEFLKKKDVPKDSHCSIRKTSSLKTRHTPHKRGIPKRESTKQVEQEIEVTILLEKEVSKINEEVEALKITATKCFENGDFQGAVNAYTKAIELSPLNAGQYSNRAAGYIALKSYDKAIQDCTKALEILNLETEQNDKSRLLCHVRRGTSYVYLNSFKEGLQDYEIALQIDPSNATLEKDVQAIRAISNSSSDTDETDNLSTSQDSSSFLSKDSEENEC